MATQSKSIAGAPERLYPWQRPEPGVTTIGMINPCYGSSHVIYGLDTQRYRHRRLASLPLRRLDRDGSTYHRFTPFILDASVPLVHTWNAVPLNRDFVVSFELELPRYLGNPSEAQMRRGLGILESKRCKRILALSEFARGFAARTFEKHGFGHLTDKMDVFRGAIPDVYAPGTSRQPGGIRTPFAEKPLSAVVLGTQLFHKGAMHAIRAFDRLRAQGMNLTLTLIGDFETSSHTFANALPDAGIWRAEARKRDWIRFTGPIPYAQVFPELLAHDITIYTSLDESLGWLPIEAAMLGVPVLGTRLCALPELIAHRETGWLVDLPLRADGRWAGMEQPGAARVAAVEDANARIEAGIADCITAIYDDPSLLERWGAEGHRRMTALYGMAQASQALERIYDRALGLA
ncbi:glycosyltransferase family 4 protein [Sphingomonas quercus]|uniref:Glycosyltransferase family 4 protein n=1 Tax=Sphingomonas quercus TaxID=2842451 RepID=A0ABS6BMH2_9SPHN|nr:glycosyltransferase family 4 protein [Sphingomonas quercus]MBU3078400.1 glycosyltransferase family 4 protein [Sphingomonas quercus]